MRRWRLALACVAMLATACSSRHSASECTSNTDCSAGQVCTSGACKQLCTSDLDCSSGQVCTQSVCVPGTRGEPSISEVDGVGPADGASGHAAHLLATHLVVRGDNLEGAHVTLTPSGGGNAIEPAVCSQTSGELQIKPPADLAPGDYVLTVTNQAGTCSSDLSIVQGVQGPSGASGPSGPSGPAGSPDSGSDIVSKLNDAATMGAIDASRLAPAAIATGGNLVPDPYFQSGTAFWKLAAGTGAINPSADALAGGAVFENNATQIGVITSTARIPVEANGTYEVRGSFRRSSNVGDSGTVQLGVRLWDSTMQEIASASGARWWYMAVPGTTLAATDRSWHTYYGAFGAHTDQPLPAAARYMSVGAVLDQGPGITGNSSYQVSGLGLYDASQRSPYLRLNLRGTGDNRPTPRLVTADNFVLVNGGGRGFNLLALDANGNVVHNQTYDAYGTPGDTTQMVTDLGSLDSSDLVIITSSDAWETDTTAALVSALANCGASSAALTPYVGTTTNIRHPYALIGYPGLGDGNGLESLQANGAGSPYATLQALVRWDTTAGQYQIVGL